MKKLMSFVLMFIVAFTLVGCQKDVLPTSIALSTESDKTTIAVGETLAITAVVSPDNATDKGVEWASSNTNVATVNSGGVVTGRNAGTTTITATAKAAEGVTQTLTITVEAGSVTNVTIRGEAEVNEGATTKLTATLTPTGAQGTVVWASDNEGVATVDQTGSVTGVAAGTATITATVGEVKGEFKITVNAVAEVVTSVKIYAPQFLLLGTTTVATVKSNLEEVPVVTWTSSNALVATIAPDGTITAVSTGTTTITAKYSDTVSSVHRITVVAEEVATTSIAISGPERIAEGLSGKYTIDYTPEDATDVGVTWGIKDNGEEFATIDEDGNLKAIKIGSVTITATLTANPELTAEFIVAITAPILAESISVKASMNPIQMGTPMTIQATFTPEDTTDKELVWTSSNPDVATVNSETGSFTTISVGKTTITATVKNQPEVSSSIEIEVIAKEVIKPTSISISGPQEVYPGDKIRYEAIVLPTGVSQAVTWEVQSRTADYMKYEGGVFEALKTGTARIRAISVADSKITSPWFTIAVLEPRPVYPAPDMGGYKVTIMQSESAVNEIDPFHDNYSSSDQNARKDAWAAVKTEFNCDIEVVPYPDSASWGPARITWISQQASLQQAGADVYVISAEWIPELQKDNSFVDVTDFYKKHTMNLMEKASLDAATYKGKYYAIATGIPDARNYIVNGLFMNIGLMESKGIQNPAELFNAGTWTYDDFVNWAVDAQTKLDEGQYVLAGAPQLYWSGMVQAGGVRLADTAALNVNITSETSLSAVNALRRCFEGGAVDPEVGYDQSVTTFQQNNALIQPGQYWFIHHSTRFPENLWGEGTTKYGYVPFPYPNDKTKEETFVNLCDESVYTIPTGRAYGTGVDAEAIYRVWSQTYLKTMEIRKQDTSYDPEAALTSAISSKIETTACVDAMMFYTADKTLYDPIWNGIASDWSSDLATTVYGLVLDGGDAYSELEALVSSLRAKVIEIYG